MARIKSNKQIKKLADWPDADEFVRQISELQFLVKISEDRANRKINEIKSYLAAEIKPMFEQIMILTDSLEAFAANHMADFGKAQSKKLNFGTIGWRKSTAIKIKKTTLELVKKLLGEKYLHIKEEVNKEALKELSDQQLVKVDAKREDKEPFFVEPQLTEAANLSEKL